MVSVLDSVASAPLVVKMPSSVVQMNDDQFFDFCQANHELQIERTAEGDVLIMSPEGFGSGRRNAIITTRLSIWTERNGMGVVLDSSGGFRLPNRAVRSPDAAWILSHGSRPSRRRSRKSSFHFARTL